MFHRKSRHAVFAFFFLVLLCSSASVSARDLSEADQPEMYSPLLRTHSDLSACGSRHAFVSIFRRVLFAEPSCEARLAPQLTAYPCGSIHDMSWTCKKDDELVAMDLADLGKRGQTIAKVREQVLEILETENGCSAWFQGVDPDPAATFRSARFVVDEMGQREVYARKMPGDLEFFKHPYVASSIQNAGRNAVIQLNANGAFFVKISRVLEQPQPGEIVRLARLHGLTVASYEGDTPMAQITTVLHELGHITGRIPEDDDSWPSQSERNTEEVLRYCKSEITAAAWRIRHGEKSKSEKSFIPK
jgi:P2-related tail formation protein